MPFDNLLSPLQIALWEATPGSGKTCFVRAMRESLNRFHQPNLDLFISDILDNGQKQEILGDDLTKLDLTDYSFWRVGRRSKDTANLNASDKKRIRISSNEHKLLIYDQSKEEKNNKRPYNYMNAHLVILMLDPTKLVNFNANSIRNLKPSTSSLVPPPNKHQIDLTEFVKESIFFRNAPNDVQQTPSKLPDPQEYKRTVQTEYVNVVKDFLRSIQKSELRLAVCITKIDQLPLNQQNIHPKKLLPILFGQEMINAFNVSPDLDIYFYAVSAFGKQPNITSELELTEMTNLWQPINIEKPVLELLEDRERRRIKKKYGFGCIAPFLSDLLASPMSQENLNQYIPYSEGSSTSLIEGNKYPR